MEKGLPKQIERVKHHAAMPFAAVGAFILSLRNSKSNLLTKLAFEFLVLTAARTSEVLEARWSEVDFDQELWTLPASRMKASREHRVPLPPRCVALLTEAARHSSGSEFIFPGRSLEKPLSNMAFAEILKGMELKVTVHGFRSSFRDWAAEETAFPREVAEMALAHTIESKVEAAYRRGDLLDKRRDLMTAWQKFLLPLE